MSTSTKLLENFKLMTRPLDYDQLVRASKQSAANYQSQTKSETTVTTTFTSTTSSRQNSQETSKKYITEVKITSLGPIESSVSTGDFEANSTSLKSGTLSVKSNNKTLLFNPMQNGALANKIISNNIFTNFLAFFCIFCVLVFTPHYRQWS
jgi:hypothetical protein